MCTDLRTFRACASREFYASDASLQAATQVLRGQKWLFSSLYKNDIWNFIQSRGFFSFFFTGFLLLAEFGIKVLAGNQGTYHSFQLIQSSTANCAASWAATSFPGFSPTRPLSLRRAGRREPSERRCLSDCSGRRHAVLPASIAWPWPE